MQVCKRIHFCYLLNFQIFSQILLNKYKLISVTFLLLCYVYSKLCLVRNILWLLIISLSLKCIFQNKIVEDVY